MSPVLQERAAWLGRHVLPHEPALRLWLRGRNLGDLEADDVIQETYTRLMTAENVQHIHNVKTYLFQTAVSVVVDHLRRLRVISIGSVADLDQLEIAADAPSPEHEAIDRDELHRLARAIAGLPDRVREVFTLRRVYGFSQREVAEKMGIAESTVEKHMSRGLLLMLNLFGYGGKGTADTSTPMAPKNRARRSYVKKDRS